MLDSVGQPLCVISGLLLDNRLLVCLLLAGKWLSESEHIEQNHATPVHCLLSLACKRLEASA